MDPSVVRVGTSGWGYDDWRGGFYSRSTEPRDYLKSYARVFDAVEVNSSFYGSSSRERFAQWADVTPAGFVFAVKVPDTITHDARLRDVAPLVAQFLADVEPLAARGKLGPLLAQLPPSLKRTPESARDLAAFLALVPRAIDVSVEFRHASWWTPETFAALAARNAALTWSVNDYVAVPEVMTADWAYVRFIGNHQDIQKFDRIQADRSADVRAFKSRFHRVTTARAVYVFINNHFMGFAPATAQMVQRELGLPVADLARAQRAGPQRGLAEF